MKKNSLQFPNITFIRELIFLLSFLFSPIASAKSAAINNYDSIVNKKVFVLHQGINLVNFWGIDSDTVRNEGGYKPRLVMRPSAIVYVENGGNNSAAGSLYFIFSGVKLPIVAVSISDEQSDLLFEKPAIGQAYASAVRLFNGVFRGHCQTFLVLAETDTNEDNNISKTTMKLYEFDPGSFYQNNQSQVADIHGINVEYGPIFVLKKKYISKVNNSDPQVVLAKEFGFPLPPSYDLSSKNLSNDSKSLGLPTADDRNSYETNMNTNCSIK